MKYLILIISLLAACASDPGTETPNYIDWETQSHSDEINANYEKVFADSVLAIKIKISSENYAKMQKNLETIVGKFGEGIDKNKTPPPELFKACEKLEEGATCEATIIGAKIKGDCFRGPFESAFCKPEGEDPQMPKGEKLIDVDPDYYPIDLVVEDHIWRNVGMRYKGNSSLSFSWKFGVLKLPFKLKFDEFEDDFPEIDNQRFYGFKKLSFASGFNDNSLMRDALASDILEDHGIPAAKHRFVHVQVDFGKGPINYGLYTMIEDPSDAMMTRVKGNKDGNIYKPEGPGADWTHFNKKGFSKKNNKKEKNWTDVENAIAALYADRSDAAAWREALDKSFDTQRFLKWLAVNTFIGNWDAYGLLPHNYYLYSDAKTGRIEWIPWDHNEAFKQKNQTDFGEAPSLLLTEIDDKWPLVRFLLDDPIYKQIYLDELDAVSKGLARESAFAKRVDKYRSQIADFAKQEAAPYTTRQGNEDLESATTSLKAYMKSRHLLLKAALKK